MCREMRSRDGLAGVNDIKYWTFRLTLACRVQKLHMRMPSGSGKVLDFRSVLGGHFRCVSRAFVGELALQHNQSDFFGKRVIAVDSLEWTTYISANFGMVRAQAAYARAFWLRESRRIWDCFGGVRTHTHRHTHAHTMRL